MKKILTMIFLGCMMLSANGQITITAGSAYLQTPGTTLHIPVMVKGLDGAAGGTAVSGLEFHIRYLSSSLFYDTTLNFSPLTPATQWYFSANGIEYATNWIEPGLSTLNIPDNTVLFEMVFKYLGGTTELIFDTAKCLVLDAEYNEIPGVNYVSGIITPGQGSGNSVWNGTGPWTSTGNWSNGIPGDSTHAIIESGHVTLLSNGSCKSITIQSGTQVTLDPGFSLTINGPCQNNGTLRVRSDATGTGSIIVIGDLSGSGKNEFERYFPFQSGFSHHTASPVFNANVAVLGASATEKYMEASSSWQPMSGSDILENGKGVQVTGTGPSTAIFSGLFPTGDITRSDIAFTASGSASQRGLNLLGNPYPSAIQWDKGDWSRKNLDYAAYVWHGYKYLVWNGFIGSLKNGIIPAMQGFFVKSNAPGGSITIPANSRLHDNQPFYKASESESNILIMKLEHASGNGFFDEAFVNIRSTSTTGYDGATDAWKLFGPDAYPQLYTLSSNQDPLAINTQPEFGSIPVEFRVGEPGSYKISFDQTESFQPLTPLYFEDKETQTIINIRNSKEFVFNTENLSHPGRLVLHLTEVSVTNLQPAEIRVWCNGHRCRIQTPRNNEPLDEINIYNLTGQRVFHSGHTLAPCSLDLPAHLHGMHILKIRSAQSYYTYKIIISHR